MPDGDFVDLGWSEACSNGPIAVLVHGLTGGFESKYLRGLSKQLMASGWRTAILQLRGAGPEPNRVARQYHQGDTADSRHVLQLLREREPDAPIAIVGWSLGANIVLKLMGEQGDGAVPFAAAAACAPMRLKPCTERLRRGFSKVYQAKLLRDLKAGILRKHVSMPVPENVDLPTVLQARDFFEFDDAFTAPLNGFLNAEDYYARCESAPFLAGIRRPTLIVNALDDPFMDERVIPAAEELSPHVQLELTRHGGHVGFVASGRFGQPVYWLEQRLSAYLNEQLALHVAAR